MKYADLGELLDRESMTAAEPNKHHPRLLLWKRWWPQLQQQLVGDNLPSHLVDAIASATCTERKVVRFEVQRRVALAALKQQEASVKEEQRASGLAAAVSELLVRERGKANVPNLVAFLKDRNVMKGWYQAGVRSALVSVLVKQALTVEERGKLLARAVILKPPAVLAQVAKAKPKQRPKRPQSNKPSEPAKRSKKERAVRPLRADAKESECEDESSDSEASDSAEEDIDAALGSDMIEAMRISLDPVLSVAPVLQRARRRNRGAAAVQIEETPAIQLLLTEGGLRDHKYKALLEDWVDCRPLNDKSKPSPKAVGDMFDNAQQWAARVILQRQSG
jgi:hypothetical protein